MTEVDLWEDPNGIAHVESVRGTPYPSVEVWQYSDSGAALVYNFDANAAGTGPMNLFQNDEDLLQMQPAP